MYPQSLFGSGAFLDLPILTRTGVKEADETVARMVVSFLRRFVYLGPPKTASTSLHEWLSQPVLCERPWRAENGGQHEMRAPLEADAFFVFASIRNPYSRAVSLWRHSLVSGAAENPPTPKLDFADFIKWLPAAPAFYARSQMEWLAETRLDAVVRIEEIESILDLPPIAAVRSNVLPIPRRNVTEHLRWLAYYDSGLAGAVYRHFVDDFQRLGYPREISSAFDSPRRMPPFAAIWESRGSPMRRSSDA